MIFHLEKSVSICASRAFVRLFCTRQFLFLFSSPWCQGLAAVFDYGTSWTFLLTFFFPVMGKPRFE